MSYDPTEQDVLLNTFTEMLRAVTKDGGRKRARGEKPPWWRDGAHEAAIYSHLNKWKHGEVADPDSGAHPLVHLAWRALAIAWQESSGKRDPAPPRVADPAPLVGTLEPNAVWRCGPTLGATSGDIRCDSCGASVFDGEDHSRCRGSA